MLLDNSESYRIKLISEYFWLTETVHYNNNPLSVSDIM